MWFRWRRSFNSIDPLAEKYYSISEYAYVANNPLKYIDLRGDSLTIAGPQSQEGTDQFQARAGSAMTLSKDDAGNITYTINNDKKGKPMKLKGDAKRLAEVIYSKEVMVNVKTTNNNKASNGGQMIGGAFMGNTVIKDATGNVVKVIANQEVNTSILGRVDAIKQGIQDK